MISPSLRALSLSIFFIALSVFSLYSNFHYLWRVTPPIYILLLLSITGLVLSIKSTSTAKNRSSKIMTWLSITLSVLLTIALILGTVLTVSLSAMGAREKLTTVKSPDERYTIDFYHFDAGAAGTFGIMGELNGPLWTKKKLYYQQHAKEVNVKWQSEGVVTINNRELDLEKGEVYGYE